MPEAAASVGKALREFQKASAELTEALNAEVAVAQAAKAAIAQPDRLDDAVVEALADLDASSSEASLASSTAIDPLAPAPWEAVPGEPKVAIGTGRRTMVEPPPISAPIIDPTGMSPLPASLTAPSESMREATRAKRRRMPGGTGGGGPSLAWPSAVSDSPIALPSSGDSHTVGTVAAFFGSVGHAAATVSPTEA
jgi:Sec-independent protein translocase protein TatA